MIASKLPPPSELPKAMVFWKARAEIAGMKHHHLIRITYCSWSDYRLDFLLNEEDVSVLLRDLLAAKAYLENRRGVVAARPTDEPQ